MGNGKVCCCKADHAVETERLRPGAYHIHTDRYRDTGTQQATSQTLANRHVYTQAAGACRYAASTCNLITTNRLSASYLTQQCPAVSSSLWLYIYPWCWGCGCTWSSSVHDGWWAEQRFPERPPGHLQHCQMPVEIQYV